VKLTRERLLETIKGVLRESSGTEFSRTPAPDLPEDGRRWRHRDRAEQRRKPRINKTPLPSLSAVFAKKGMKEDDNLGPQGNQDIYRNTDMETLETVYDGIMDIRELVSSISSNTIKDDLISAIDTLLDIIQREEE
jgi:hypothetical protein